MDPNEYRFSNGVMTVIGVYRDLADVLKISLNFKTDNGKINKTVVIDYGCTNDKRSMLSCIPDGFRYDVSNNKFWQELRNHIQKAVDDMEIGTVIPYGYSTVNGNVVFNLGGKLINSVSAANVLAANPKQYKVNLCEHSYSEQHDWILTYINQNTATAVLFLCAYSNFIQPLLSTVNLRPVNAFCCGESGYGKTEEAKLVLSFFDGTIVGCNLGSDKSAIVKTYADCMGLPFLLDDLNNSPVPRERERREDNLCRIIQMQASGGETINKDVIINDSVHSGLIITAEYTLEQSISTMNRVVLLLFDEPFQDDVLTWLQENRQLNVCFLHGFIAWICRKMAYLNDLVSSYPFNFPCIENLEKSTGRKRITASYHSLCITEAILLMYMNEVGIVTKEEQSEINQAFDIAINKAIEDTIEVCTPKEATSAEINALEFVLGVLSAKTYSTKNIREYYEDSNYVLLKIKGFYCFKGRRMIDHLEKNGIDITIKQLTKLLNRVKLIVYRGSEASFKLPKEYDDKTRWFHIPKKVVKDLRENDMNLLFEEVGLILDSEENKEWRGL